MDNWLDSGRVAGDSDRRDSGHVAGDSDSRDSGHIVGDSSRVAGDSDIIIWLLCRCVVGDRIYFLLVRL